jgi:hypothetical protein
MAHKIQKGWKVYVSSSPIAFKSIQNFSGERGEGTLSLSAFIFKVLDSAGWDGAPNFPPHDLMTIVSKCNKND